MLGMLNTRTVLDEWVRNLMGRWTPVPIAQREARTRGLTWGISRIWVVFKAMSLEGQGPT